MMYYWIASAVVGLALTVLGFFMMGWREVRGLVGGGPYVLFGLMTVPVARHLAPVSEAWETLLYALGVSSVLFGLAVLSFEPRAKTWFVLRYFLAGVFWLVLAVAIPDVTSSMRMFPVFIGLAYVGIAVSTRSERRLDGGHVGPDVALNAMGFLFLGILLASVPDFFTHAGTSIWTP